MIKPALLTLLFSFSSTSTLAQPESPSPNDHRVHPGDRMGLHGMTLTGAGPYLMSHIPMFQSPHDMQLVYLADVGDENGEDLNMDLSQEGWSVRPDSTFSLGDFALGKVAAFTGSLHRGNFEHGGALVLEKVEVQVQGFLINNTLPQPLQENYSHALIRIADQLWLVDKINSQAAVQRHLQVTIKDPAMLAKVPEGLTQVALPIEGSFREGAQLEAEGYPVDAEPLQLQLEITKRIWCLQAPDFFSSCAVE